MTDVAMKAIAAAIRAAGVTKVTIGELPENGMNCVAIHPTDGYPSTTYFGQQDTLEPLIEVLIRTNDYPTGQQMYMQALKATDKFSNENAGILSCVNVGSPGYLGKSSEGFCEWHFMLHVSLIDY